MAADIEVALIDPGFLVGKDKASVNVFVDEQSVNEMKIGQTKNIETSSGVHTVYIQMKLGPIARKSNKIKISASEGEKISVKAKYSRIWGKYKLSV